MILDVEKSIIAVPDKYIYLSPRENMIFSLLIRYKDIGITLNEFRYYIYPYKFGVWGVINTLNKKIKDYGKIYYERYRYRIMIYTERR